MSDGEPYLFRSHTADAIGLTVQTITPDLAQQFNAKVGRGVVVTEVKQGSVAEMAGIHSGAVILQVNQVDVNSAADFQRAVASSAADKRVLLLVSEQGMSRYVVLSWG